MFLTLCGKCDRRIQVRNFGISNSPNARWKGSQLLAASALLVALFFTCVSVAQAESNEPVLQLTTKLGNDCYIQLDRITVKQTSSTYDDTLLNYVANNSSVGGTNFLLRVDNGFYMIIPIEQFCQVELLDGFHVVTLANKKQLKGKLVGLANAYDSEKSYDLSTATRIKLVLPEREQSSVEGEVIETKGWTLHIANPVDRSYIVSYPRFAFEYYSTKGYIMGGVNRGDTASHIYVKVDDQEEEIVTTLENFAEISINVREVDEVRLKSETGVEAKGEFILRSDERLSISHEHGDPWYFIADLEDGSGVKVALNGLSFDLIKRDRPSATIQENNEEPTLQFTTELGIRDSFPLKEVYIHSDRLADPLYGSNEFTLHVQDGFYMLIPIEKFHKAELVDGMHIVTLRNKQQLKGRLATTIRNGYFGQRRHSLNIATKIELLNLKEEEIGSKESGGKASEIWELHSTKPAVFSNLVSNPRLYGSYEKNPSFYIKVGDEEILANLTDFAEISFAENEVRLKSESGVETTGMPIIRHKRDTFRYWFLVADLADNGGATILLENPVCSLIKVPKQ